MNLEHARRRLRKLESAMDARKFAYLARGRAHDKDMFLDLQARIAELLEQHPGLA